MPTQALGKRGHYASQDPTSILPTDTRMEVESALGFRDRPSRKDDCNSLQLLSCDAITGVLPEEQETLRKRQQWKPHTWIKRSAYLLRACREQDAISTEHPRMYHDPPIARPRGFAFYIHPFIHSHRVHVGDMDSMVDRRHGLEIPRHPLPQGLLCLEFVYQSVDARRRVEEEDIGQCDEAEEIGHVAVCSRDGAVGTEPVPCEF